ncbi:MAG: hypothetical protein LBS10_08530 [Gracilibacteraceae bacterium]|nr:hypothetical protein [Gracilibacteraceae bacterium]
MPLAVVSVLTVVLLVNMAPRPESPPEKEAIPVLAASGNENLVEILPQTEREDDAPAFDGEDGEGTAGEGTEGELIDESGNRLYPTKDPFADAELTNITFVGALLSGDGSGVAMLRGGDTSYIVRTGDFVGKSAWQIASLTADSVTLKNGAVTRVLYMDKPDLTDIIK